MDHTRYKKSSKNVRLLNWLKKCMTISRRSKQYIDNYNRIYKRVLKEAERRENNRLLLKATNKPKVIWKIIKNEIGKSTNSMQDITLDIQSDDINDLHKIADLFNTFFCETPTKLLRNNKRNDSMSPVNTE